MRGLIAVDLQNDFCRGGALAVPDGDAVIAPLNELAGEVDFVVATRDWHPPDHSSFVTQGGPWPVHCVQGTPGAELHPDFDQTPVDLVVDAGRRRDLPGYSAFEDTDLESVLREHQVDDLYIGGLALDYCVKATALDARWHGFHVVLHLVATRAVEVNPGDGERAVEELRTAGVEIEGES